MRTMLKRFLVQSPVGPLAMAVNRMRFQEPLRSVVARNNAYDLQTIQVMRRVLRVDDACVDVGAHTGDILWQMARVAPYGRHFAFEPIPHLAAGLRADFPDVTVIESAVSDKPGRSSFVFVENAPGYSGLRERRYDRPDPIKRELTVEVVRIDDVIDRPVRFIKIDVEGGEYHALLGASQVIREYQPIIVFEAGKGGASSYGVSAHDFVRLMNDMGYKLSTMRRWLAGATPYGRDEFEANWDSGPDYYFIAYP